MLWWVPPKTAEAAFPRRDQDLICKTKEQLEAFFFFFLRKMTINMQRVPDAKEPFPNSRVLLPCSPLQGNIFIQGTDLPRSQSCLAGSRTELWTKV